MKFTTFDACLVRVVVCFGSRLVSQKAPWTPCMGWNEVHPGVQRHHKKMPQRLAVAFLGVGGKGHRNGPIRRVVRRCRERAWGTRFQVCATNRYSTALCLAPVMVWQQLLAPFRPEYGPWLEPLASGCCRIVPEWPPGPSCPARFGCARANCQRWEKPTCCRRSPANGGGNKNQKSCLRRSWLTPKIGRMFAG